MYPSNSFYAGTNNNDENLTSPYTFDQILLNQSSIFEINPSSKQGSHLHSPLYFNIASSCNLDENDDAFMKHRYDLYFQQRSQITKFNAPDSDRPEMNSYNIEDRLGESSSKQNKSCEVIKEIPEKKASKKDRHSKIETAQGPRDRRVRLSLQVARDFFDLQDTLGYTRASKTVEWLLSNSKEAIKDVTSSSANSPFSSFECEVVSEEKVKHLGSLVKETKNARGSTRKPASNPLAKESREKARARARERTKERLKVNVLNIGSETTMMNQTNSLGYWSQNKNKIPQVEVFGDVPEPSSSMVFNYHTRNSQISHEDQVVEHNLHGKPWDAYDNSNLC